MCAAMLNDAKLIREIVEAGANVSHANPFGTTPLMVASFLNNQDAMLALMKAGADIDQVRPIRVLDRLTSHLFCILHTFVAQTGGPVREHVLRLRFREAPPRSHDAIGPKCSAQ
jgi:ankyrin repeat protein